MIHLSDGRDTELLSGPRAAEGLASALFLLAAQAICGIYRLQPNTLNGKAVYKKDRSEACAGEGEGSRGSREHRVGLCMYIYGMNDMMKCVCNVEQYDIIRREALCYITYREMGHGAARKRYLLYTSLRDWMFSGRPDAGGQRCEGWACAT